MFKVVDQWKFGEAEVRLVAIDEPVLNYHVLVRERRSDPWESVEDGLALADVLLKYLYICLQRTRQQVKESPLIDG